MEGVMKAKKLYADKSKAVSAYKTLWVAARLRCEVEREEAIFLAGRIEGNAAYSRFEASGQLKISRSLTAKPGNNSGQVSVSFTHC